MAGANRSQERLQLQNVLREGLGGLRRTTQGVEGYLIRARGAAEPKVDAARKQSRQRPELLGDHIRRMVREHDAPGPDPNGRRSGGEMSKHDRCRCAGDARHVVMLRHPDTPIAPFLGVGGEVASIVEGAARVGLLRDANKFENG